MDEDDLNDGISLEDALAKFAAKRETEEPQDEPEEDPEEPEEEPEEESEEEPSEDDDTSEEDGEDEDEEPSEKPKKTARADDEAEVEVVVNGETKTLKVGDLKRLAGQEAALTRKSQAVATQHKAIEEQSLYVANILDAQWKAAKAQHDKYANVDLIEASRKLEDDDFTALRDAKVAAEQQFQAIDRESREFITRARTAHHTVLKERAKVALQVITQKIPDWNDQVYGDVRAFAVSQGMDPASVNEIVDPGIIVMMHTAMQHYRSKAKAETVQKKVAKAPTKVVKKSATTDSTAQSLKALRLNAEADGDEDSVMAYLAAKRRRSE